jgi:predicted nucleotidyltransferase
VDTELVATRPLPRKRASTKRPAKPRASDKRVGAKSATAKRKSRRRPSSEVQASAQPSVTGLLAALDAVSKWLDSKAVRFAVIGGLAASLHGKPRVTKDVDLVALADEADWIGLLEQAAAWQIEARIADAIEFAKLTRMLLLVHSSSGIEVDLSFGMLPFELEVVQRAQHQQVGGLRFPLATAEDIIIMKALALRARDIADIEGIVELVQNLDLVRVRTTVAQLSQALESIDHLAQLDEILRRVNRS